MMLIKAMQVFALEQKAVRAYVLMPVGCFWPVLGVSSFVHNECKSVDNSELWVSQSLRILLRDIYLPRVNRRSILCPFMHVKSENCMYVLYMIKACFKWLLFAHAWMVQCTFKGKFTQAKHEH